MSANSAGAPVRVFIGAGANVDPEANIAAALDRLSESVGIDGVSPFYWSAAIGRPEQPDYLNGVVRVHTRLGARALKFDVLRAIETALGRGRGADPYAARPIDLDVLLYGDRVINEAGLVVPDPDLCTRPFLAAGVLAFEPDLKLPDTGAALRAYGDTAALVDATAFSEAMKARFGR